jgi:hypothetical protein
VKEDSCLQRLEAFFSANPDEELTVAQACLKFDISEQTLRLAMNDLIRAGALEYVRVLRPAAKGRRQ